MALDERRLSGPLPPLASSPTPGTRSRTWAAAMTLLSGFFALRVAGQAVQRWAPREWLPPFASWQGSSTPYALLLSAQLLIVGLTVSMSYRAWHGRLGASRASVAWLAVLGLVYFLGSAARLAVGLAFETAPSWFHAWISGAFHLVLAGFVLATVGYRRSQGLTARAPR